MNYKSLTLTDWTRLLYALIAFAAILMYLELFLPGVVQLNAQLDQTHAQAGYIAALRGQTLLLWVLAALVMVSLFRQGVPIAPLAWFIQIARLGYLHADPWYEIGNSLFFVSPLLNFVLMLLVAPLLALIIWWSFEQLAIGRLRKFLDLLSVPGLWVTTVLLVAVGNLFFWYWSQVFALSLWPSGLGLVLLVCGLPLVMLGSLLRPVAALLVYWGALALTIVLGWLIWGLVDGTIMALLVLLSVWGDLSFTMIWVELLLLFAVPLIAVVALCQLRNWRSGKKILEIW